MLKSSFILFLILNTAFGWSVVQLPKVPQSITDLANQFENNIQDPISSIFLGNNDERLILIPALIYKSTKEQTLKNISSESYLQNIRQEFPDLKNTPDQEIINKVQNLINISYDYQSYIDLILKDILNTSKISPLVSPIQEVWILETIFGTNLGKTNENQINNKLRLYPLFIYQDNQTYLSSVTYESDANETISALLFNANNLTSIGFYQKLAHEVAISLDGKASLINSLSGRTNPIDFQLFQTLQNHAVVSAFKAIRAFKIEFEILSELQKKYQFEMPAFYKQIQTEQNNSCIQLLEKILLWLRDSDKNNGINFSDGELKDILKQIKKDKLKGPLFNNQKLCPYLSTPKLQLFPNDITTGGPRPRVWD